MRSSLRCERMMVSRRAVLLFSFLALLALSCVAQVYAEAGEVEARVALDNVAVFVEKAFLAVVDAEEAGANVTTLKAALGYAGELLAGGEANFRFGNFSGAVDFALLANESVKDVAADASLLAVAARENWSQRYYWAVLESSLGVSLAVFVVLLGWVYFRRLYTRRVLDMKPEVTKSES